ncbi:MAG: hypothetical protein ACI4MB_04820 [Candidatus Coproplasma sp.]
MTAKTKKILNIVLDVVIAIVLVFAAFLAIVSIRSKAKGYGQYTEVFGTAYLAVASDSMDAEKPSYVPEGKLEGFAKGDLIKIKLVNEEQAKEFEVGDIITFESSEISAGKRVLNTHRIIEVITDTQGNVTKYRTHGDNNPLSSNETVSISDIVGVYEGKASGIGHVFLFMGTTAGFFVCIVLPTLLIVAYCVYNLIVVIKKEKKVQAADAEAEKEAEKERIRQELLAEMQAANTSAPSAEVVEEPVEEPKDTETKE